MSKQLPKPVDLLIAKNWLDAGCPVLPVDKAFIAIDVLKKIVDALPEHFPRYCYASEEWKEAGGWAESDYNEEM